ncbi:MULTISPECIES: AAA family ATPase [unclassified Microbacterium]|uniref:AAA family ATPase n=1 Tax=unclassified Microbacterium TaxID=2609290 RepID=UPI00214BDCE2|nr:MULTISPECIES: AAA family ATPase [unclassified Microbacterium]MCR2810308.1 AAA family ATPase [Microbacterium sp. zg.B185]WIM18369.1 AAA family ATPase [Microbacterium sp. zg-B185]
MSIADVSAEEQVESGRTIPVRFTALELTNFLSYKHARLELADLIALVGPNASGKSNLVAAIKLLREIPIHGLPVALARRGGFDQLRHRSSGHPYDPSLRIEFHTIGSDRESFYEIKLGAVNPRSYRVKSEVAQVWIGDRRFSLSSDGSKVTSEEPDEESKSGIRRHTFPVPPGQSAMSASGGFAGFIVSQVLQTMQTVEINPAMVADLQLPSSQRDFEPDGSNATSLFELLSPESRAELIDELSALVPGIVRVEIQRLADRQTFRFTQSQESGNRAFYAKQMSDGTLRAFSILLAMKQPARPNLLVIEEPEVAIHLGALRTLMDILAQESERSQIVVTTHSADIVDSIDVESLRVVWGENGQSHVGVVAPHTVATVRSGLVTPGELLRSDALDVDAL